MSECLVFDIPSISVRVRKAGRGWRVSGRAGRAGREDRVVLGVSGDGAHCCVIYLCL